GCTFTGGFYKKGHIMKVINIELIKWLEQLQPVGTGFYFYLLIPAIGSCLKFQHPGITLNPTWKRFPVRFFKFCHLPVAVYKGILYRIESQISCDAQGCNYLG